MELSGQILPEALAGTSNAGMEKFSIAVSYCNRTYRYNVERQLVDAKEEVISLTRLNKTVVLAACPPDSKNCSRKYSYDKEAITNRFFMARVITALEQYWHNEDRGTK